jgi:hypothetical protein
MNITELVNNYINGNKREVAEEIKNNYGWYSFATDLEKYDCLTVEQKYSMLISLIRISNR